MAVGEEINDARKEAWQCLRESKAHLQQTRSAEANSRTPTLPSPDAPLNTDPHMSNNEFAADLFMIALESIWRLNKKKFSSTEADTLPPLPPSLPHDTVKQDMSNEDSMSEIVTMVWEFTWQVSEAYQQRIRRAAVIVIPTSRPTPASLSPGVPSGMPFKRFAAEIETVWKCLRSHVPSHVHRRQATSAADASLDAIAELRHLLQQLQNLPKKVLVMEIFKYVRGSVDGNNLDATIAGVEEALQEVDRHLRAKRHQQEPPAHHRGKRAFTNSREVDIALISGILVMSVIVVIIGNLDPVTRTY